MLHDTFMETLWGCGTVILVVLTLVIVKAGFVYLAVRRSRSPRRVETTPDTGPGIAVPEPEPVHVTPKVEALPVEPVAAEKVPELEPDTIECGSCGKEIKSGFIEIRKQKQGADHLIFECEHCNAKVAIEAV